MSKDKNNFFHNVDNFVDKHPFFFLVSVYPEKARFRGVDNPLL